MKRKLSWLLCQSCLAAGILIPALPASAVDSDYVLQPGDGILITVFEQDELTTETQIAESGEIVMPLIGSVAIGGKSVKAAVADLTNRLSQGFVVDPKVTLTVTGVGVSRAIVIGMVHRPGPVDFPSKRPLDALGAIAMAGGFTPSADLGGVSIRRGEQVIKVDSRKLTGEDAGLVLLEPDDVVSVGQAFAQRVTVMGEVVRPGFVEAPNTGELHLLSAIALAGGYTDEADPSSVVVRRGNAIHRVDAGAMASSGGVAVFFVRPGDVVTVGEASARTVTILGEVQRPGLLQVPAAAGLNLLDAIAVAGGYTNNANPRKIVVRRAADESPDKFYRIDGKRLAGDGEAKPFELQPGDTVTVPERFF